jgi:predicted dinucleotide-binding enzyme
MSTLFLTSCQWLQAAIAGSFAPAITNNMYTPQTIVIIGAGEIGRAIASGLSNGSNRVLLCDQDFSIAQDVANGLQTTHPYYDIEAVACSYDATWEADIIILTSSSCPDRQEIAKKIKAVACQKVVVTTADVLIELQQLLPNSKIVQAFNGIDAGCFHQSVENRKTVNCFITGENDEAIDTVAALVKTIGFNPLIVPLEEAVTDRLHISSQD